MQKEIDTQRRRIEELEILAQKTQRRSAQFDTIQKRVNEFDTEKRVMEGKFYAEI